MTSLKCGVENCIYNENHLCEKSEIMVEGVKAAAPKETACGSFKDGGAAKNRMNVHADLETKVRCSAVSCVFNEEKNCTANRIGIEGNGANKSENTMCGSFVEQHRSKDNDKKSDSNKVY